MVNSTQSAERTQIDRELLREYYLERSIFTSPEGVLKVLSIVGCTASCALWLAGGAGGCARAGAASAAAAALLALLIAAEALWLAARAPLICFYTDVTVSTAVGLWLATSGALAGAGALCGARQALHYVHGALAAVNAGSALSGAVVTYASVTRRWGSARRPGPRPPRPSRFELEV